MTQAGDGSTDRYRSLQTIARGGMGRVDLAIRQEGAFRRVYAVKRLRDEYRDDLRARRMFLDEARVAGLVRHPNVVSVLDVGEDRSGPFLVMDFIEGVSAAKLLRRLREREVLVPVQIAVRVMREVASGLHAAHELEGTDGEPLGLVHRDVSPQNILLGYDGIARLTDFGIAKALGRVTETTTGLLKGKVGYMAPEQLKFEEPDRRSDLFSFGVVLFEMLSGERLYEADSVAETARGILNEPPPDIDDARDDVPPELVELLFELLAKEREDRPATAREVGDRLERILAELAVVEPPLSLVDYLEEHFHGEREELRAQLVALWEGEGDTLTWGPEARATVLEAATTPEAPEHGPRTARRGRAVWWSAAAVALLGTAAIAWAVSNGGSSGQRPPEDASATEVALDPVYVTTPAGGEDPSRTPGAAESQAVGDEEERGEDADASGSAEAGPAASEGAAQVARGDDAAEANDGAREVEERRRQRRRRELLRRRRAASMEDVLWEWQ